MHVVTERDWLDAVKDCEKCVVKGGKVKPCAFHADARRLIAKA